MRVAYVLIPLVLVAGALFLAFQGLRGPDDAAAPVERAEQPRFAVTGATWIRLGRQGTPEFRARADVINYYADESARLETLTLDTLGGESSPWHVEAEAGEVPPRERRMRLEGGVVATGRQAPTAAPLEFTTDTLWVDLLRRELRTESDVLLKSEFRRASARGLRADFGGERVQLLDNVRVDYAPNG